jgi:hypothetical protein
MAGKWNVPAGTKSNLNLKRKDWKSTGGAIEHKNRPESIYVTFSSWVSPKLKLTKAKANSTSDPSELVVITALDFDKEINRAGRSFRSCFDSEFFDQNSVIWTYDYSPRSAKVGKPQFIEVEINIDTVNTIDNNDMPSPNPNNGKVEMLTFKAIEPHIAKAIDKILDLDAFSEHKSLVSFSISKKGK